MRLTKFSPLTLISLSLLTLLISVSLSLKIPVLAADPSSRVLAFSVLQQQGNTARSSLFTIKANGSARRDLTPTLKDGASNPVWSPNGQRLAFVSNEQDIYVVNATSSKLTKVFSGDFCKASSFTLTWLSDSQNMAFTRACDASTLDTPGSISLYLSNTTGTQGTKLIQTWQGWTTGTPERQAQKGITSSLSVSPDGKQVVFIADKETYKMNTEGSGVTKLTNPSENPGNSIPEWSDFNWSADGTRIARIDYFYGKEPKQQIYLLNADGTLLTQFTNNGTNWSRVNLIWSPDSTKIAYYSEQPGNSRGDARDIYLLDLKGGTPKNLTQKPGQYSAFSWSPDGKQIAFIFNDKLYSMNGDGSKVTSLAPKVILLPVSDLTWSPDSQLIAFTSHEKGGKSSLYVVRRDGSGLTKLTRDRDLDAFYPVWQP
jgi:Tol biopolymer transport system component